MKRLGIVSYNIHCNFTNYGSALQSWALQKTVDKLGKGRWESVLVDYCPDAMRDKDPRNPIEHMWDTDEESRQMCYLSMPAILKNADKFDHFYQNEFRRTQGTYTSDNFLNIKELEGLDGFICGSDTIFCIDEFDGFDDGYYAEYRCMKGCSVAYAASFGDTQFTSETLNILESRLKNFCAVGLRENAMLSFVSNHTDGPASQVLDPTLLLTEEDYAPIIASRQEKRPYLLLYARRHNPIMSAYAERLATEKGWEIIEISLQAANAQRHRMFYEAGVDEFLSLVKHAEFVVTNSYHGMIFSIQFKRNFRIFSREQCDTKITNLLNMLQLPNLVCRDNNADTLFSEIEHRLQVERKKSLLFLERELELLTNNF